MIQGAESFTSTFSVFHHDITLLWTSIFPFHTALIMHDIASFLVAAMDCQKIVALCMICLLGMDVVLSRPARRRQKRSTLISADDVAEGLAELEQAGEEMEIGERRHNTIRRGDGTLRAELRAISIGQSSAT